MTANEALLAHTLRACDDDEANSDSDGGDDTPRRLLSTSLSSHDARRWLQLRPRDDTIVPACTLPRSVRCAVHVVGVSQTHTTRHTQRQRRQQEEHDMHDDDDDATTWSELSVAVQLLHLAQPLTPVLHSRIVTSEARDCRITRHNDNNNDNNNNNNDNADDDVAVTVVGEACVDERLEFTLPLCDVPLDARVACVVCDADDRVVAATSLSLYTRSGVLKMGLLRCPLYATTCNDDSDDDDDSDDESDAEVQRAAVRAVRDDDDSEEEDACRHADDAPDATTKSLRSPPSSSSSMRMLRALHTRRVPRIPWLDTLTMRHVHRQHLATHTTAAAAAAKSLSLSSSRRVVGFVHLWLPATRPACVVAFVEPSLLQLQQQAQARPSPPTTHNDDTAASPTSAVSTTATTTTTATTGDGADDATTSPLLCAYDASVTMPYVDCDAASGLVHGLCDASNALQSQSSWLHTASHLFAAPTTATSTHHCDDDDSDNDNDNDDDDAAQHCVCGDGARRCCYDHLRYASWPSAHDRARLRALARRPPIQLEPLHMDDMQLLWRHGDFVVRDRRLFLVFLRSVAWLMYVHHDNNNDDNDDNDNDNDNNNDKRSRGRRLRRDALPSHLAHAVRLLLTRWAARIGLDEVLACLSSTFARVRVVRQFAVQQLQREEDAQLCALMPQLVQAARFDDASSSSSNNDNNNNDACDDDGEGVRRARTLGGLLVSRALRSWELCCTLYWCVNVETELEAAGEANNASSTTTTTTTSMPATTNNNNNTSGDRNRRNDSSSSSDSSDSDVDDADDAHAATTTSSNSRRSTLVLTPLQALRRRLMCALAARQPRYLRRLRRQRRLLRAVRLLVAQLQRDGADRALRIAHGRQLLDAHACGLRRLLHAHHDDDDADEKSDNDDDDNAVTLPTHPRVRVCDIAASRFYVYKSAKMPVQLSFCVDAHLLPRNNNNNNNDNDNDDDACAFVPLALREAAATRTAVPSAPVVSLMYKTNDDVRQDQLMLQLLGVVDALLRRNGCDLCLTPYRVCPTGPYDGFIELVPDVVTFQDVQRDAVRYLRTHNNNNGSSGGDAFAAAMSRYTRSLAGYSVFTFVFGVGDRHLENILLARDGRLLHVDYGYVLGHDPKPFAPPMKLRREMIEVLGGPQSSGYAAFLSYCCTAYHILREHAALLLHLLLLMRHASALPQLTGTAATTTATTGTSNNNNNNSRSNNNTSASTSTAHAATATRASDGSSSGGGDVGDVVVAPEVHLLRVQDKLRLDLTHAQATQYLLNIIADSVGAVFTNLWDVLHAAAQAART